jgi:hypothetical protein
MFYKLIIPISLIFTLTSCDLLSGLKDDSSKNEDEKQSQNYGPGLVQSSNKGNKISFESKSEAKIQTVTASSITMKMPYYKCDGSLVYEEETFTYTIAGNRLILDDGDCDGIILKGNHSQIWGSWETTIEEMMLTERVCATRKETLIQNGDEPIWYFDSDSNDDDWNQTYPYNEQSPYNEYDDYEDDDMFNHMMEQLFAEEVISGTMKVDFIQSKNIAVINGRMDYCIAGMMEFSVKMFTESFSQMGNYTNQFSPQELATMQTFMPSISRGSNCNEFSLSTAGKTLEVKYAQPFVSGPVSLKVSMGNKTCERQDVLKGSGWLDFIVMSDEEECSDWDENDEDEFDALSECIEELTGSPFGMPKIAKVSKK